MEGESPLLKDGALSLQASLSHRELPPRPRRLGSEDLFRFRSVAGSWGKFFVFGREVIFAKCGFARGSLLVSSRGQGNSRRRCFLGGDTESSRTAGYNLKLLKLLWLFIYIMLLRTAEIPPAGAPSGFDFAAMFVFIICFFVILPLRSG